MSLVLKRSITLDGHKTSVTLEDEFWDALRMIAYDDKTTAEGPQSVKLITLETSTIYLLRYMSMCLGDS